MKVKLGDYDISDLLTSYTRSMSTETLVGSVPVSSLSLSFDNSDTQYNASVILNSIYEIQPTDTSQSYFFKAYTAPESYSGIVELTLYDSMYEFTLLYSSSLEYPATIQDQLDEMIDLSGIEIDYSAVDSSILSKSVESNDSTVSMRQYLSYIAELSACNVFSSNEKYAKVYFKKISDISIATKDDALEEYKKGSDLYTITAISFDNTDVSFTVGDSTSNTFLVNSDNPYVSAEDDLSVLRDTLIGMSLYSATNVEIDYINNLMVNDVITLIDFDFMVLEMTETYSGGDEPDLSLEGELTTENTESLGSDISASTQLRITKVEIDGKISALTGEFQTLSTQVAEINEAYISEATISTLLAEKGYITSLEADNLITAKGYITSAEVETLISGYAYITQADVETLLAEKAYLTEASISTVIAELGYIDEANIKKLIVSYGYVDTAYIDTLMANYITAEAIESTYVSASYLEANYIDADTLKADYIRADLTNFNVTMVGTLLANSGFVTNMTIQNGAVTGELSSVTINADLIKTGTLSVDRLLLTGKDGLIYEINASSSGLTETQLSDEIYQNYINGTVIVANSITANQIAAGTITANEIAAGTITSSEIAAGTINAININMSSLVGDEAFINAISTNTIVVSAYETAQKSVASVYVYYALSDSSTEAPTENWSLIAPEWQDGYYMWQKTVTTYNNGDIDESDITCISGATGATGADGEDAIVLIIDSSNGDSFKNSKISTTLTVSIVVGTTLIDCSSKMYDYFGEEASIVWETRGYGDNDYTELPADDSRLSDNGFIFTLTTDDVETKIVCRCYLDY